MTAIAVGAAALLLLSGCSGGTSTASGTYYGARGSNGGAAVIAVEGDTVTWGTFTCENVSGIDMEDSDTSIGTLDKTRTTVAWTQEGTYYNTDQFTESEDGSVITMGGGTYSKAGTEVGNNLLAEREQHCQEEIERNEAKEAKRAELEAGDAKLRPAVERILETLLDTDREIFDQAWVTNDYSAMVSIIAENGLTEEEFLGYMHRNSDISDLHELSDLIIGDPDGLREMMSL